MRTSYSLAIDVGTSRTAAAVARMTPGGVLSSSVPLGRASDTAPTVVFVSEGELLFGDAAERRGATDPGRLIREFKRRIGDDVPVLAGDRAFAPEELYALMVDWAARIVVDREGSSPERLAITVPAAWGEYRSDIVRAALGTQGWRRVDIVTEPEAAARHYVATNPIPPGRALAVYDFGGGTFDAVVLRQDHDGTMVAAGSPSGIADLGGADFDDIVVRHIIAAAKVDGATLAGDTAGRMALASLRRECVEAKESLSFDSEAVIPVILSGDQRTVRLTRDEFETMIADEIERTVSALENAIERARVVPEDIEAILLTGGSSRIPRVAQLLSERFDRPIAVDADPKAIIALGAARAAVERTDASEDAEVPAPEAGEVDELNALLTEGAVTRPGTRRRSWFRRVPTTAYIAGAFTMLLTGGSLLAAPALGSGTLHLEAGPAVDPRGIADRASSSARFETPSFTTAPVVDPIVPDEEAPADDSARQSTSPSAPSKTPSTSPSRSAARTEPRGTAPRSEQNGTPAGPSTGGAPSSSPPPAATNPPPAGSGSTSTPAPSDPGPATPGPTDPGPTDPGPTDPGPAEPGPSDPPVEPPSSPAPDTTAPAA